MEPESGRTRVAIAIMNAANDTKTFDLRNPFMNVSPEVEIRTTNTTKIAGEKVATKEGKDK